MTVQTNLALEDFQVMLQVVASGKETAQDKIQLPLVAEVVLVVLVVVMEQLHQTVLEQVVEQELLTVVMDKVVAVVVPVLQQEAVAKMLQVALHQLKTEFYG